MLHLAGPKPVTCTEMASLVHLLMAMHGALSHSGLQHYLYSLVILLARGKEG